MAFRLEQVLKVLVKQLIMQVMIIVELIMRLDLLLIKLDFVIAIDNVAKTMLSFNSYLQFRLILILRLIHYSYHCFILSLMLDFNSSFSFELMIELKLTCSLLEH